MKFKKAAEKLYQKLEAHEENGIITYYRKRRVYPTLSQEGKINWFNFITGGKWSKIIMLILFIGIIVGFIYEYSTNMRYCTEVLSDINKYKLQQNPNLARWRNLTTATYELNLSAYLENETKENEAIK